MSNKNQHQSFGLAIRNINVRAAIAVVSMDARTLSRLNFRPHLVLTMISKNVVCVAWFVNFLRGLSDGRRNALFRCTYKKSKYFKLLRDAGIPRHWLNAGTFTQKQLVYLTQMGYTDVSPRSEDSEVSEASLTLGCGSERSELHLGVPQGSEDVVVGEVADFIGAVVDGSYVEATLPSADANELPSPIADISIRSLSDESPPATPGSESGINMLSGAATSNELKCPTGKPKRPLPVARPHAAAGQDQCDIM